VGNLIQRGSGLWSFTSEYLPLLFEKKWFVLQGNLFVDVAGIRPSGEALKSIFHPTNRYTYSGFGLRFIHKTIYKAIFRLDYVIGLGSMQSKGIVFGIGQFFKAYNKYSVLTKFDSFESIKESKISLL
jgi:hypothetical protein